jgi:hypothetical protein
LKRSNEFTAIYSIFKPILWEAGMVKLFVAVCAATFFFAGCMINTEKCLEKEGFKNCEDFKSAAAKAEGKDEAYRFLTIGKKCNCGDY